MNYFNSRHFLNFLKNKKSMRLINQSRINKVKALCSNIIENRALIQLKNSSNTSTSALLHFPFLVKAALINSEKMEKADIVENSTLSFIMNIDLIQQEFRTDGNKNSRLKYLYAMI